MNNLWGGMQYTCVCVCVCVTCEFEFKLVCSHYTVSALIYAYSDKVICVRISTQTYSAARHAQAEQEVLTVVWNNA
jgi:hypothetical protein